jgi:dCTP diphosphatase
MADAARADSAAAAPPPASSSAATSSSSSVTLSELSDGMTAFVAEREWHRFHTPRNVLLALVGEVGEVAELFQWRGEVSPGCAGWSVREVEHLGEELSDVLLYLLRLATLTGVDLGAAARRKMALNAAKVRARGRRGRRGGGGGGLLYAMGGRALNTSPSPSPSLVTPTSFRAVPRGQVQGQERQVHGVRGGGGASGGGGGGWGGKRGQHDDVPRACRRGVRARRTARAVAAERRHQHAARGRRRRPPGRRPAVAGVAQIGGRRVGVGGLRG